MKKDIENRHDIIIIVNAFYKDIEDDVKIGHFFKEHITNKLDEHLTTIYDFWESVLFGKGSYKGNPMRTHISLNKKSPLLLEHFEYWIARWHQTVDTLHQGPIASKAKAQAINMKDLMIYKIDQSSNLGFIQ